MCVIARLALSAERKAPNLVVVGSSPTVGVTLGRWPVSIAFEAAQTPYASKDLVVLRQRLAGVPPGTLIQNPVQ